MHGSSACRQKTNATRPSAAGVKVYTTIGNALESVGRTTRRVAFLSGRVKPYDFLILVPVIKSYYGRGTATVCSVMAVNENRRFNDNITTIKMRGDNDVGTRVETKYLQNVCGRPRRSASAWGRR